MTTPITLPAIGAPFQGGFYGGQIRIDGQLYALIVAPKISGETSASQWADTYENIPGAQSYHDGYTNTQAMFEAGCSPLATWAWTLNIEGYTDWYLPSQDELEVLHRNLKPGEGPNWCYARSGINVSAAEPTRPYTSDNPVQTSAQAFQEGAGEGFDPEYYWSSTQHAGYEGYAWCQYFDHGHQGFNHKGNEFRARAVRRLAIS